MAAMTGQLPSNTKSSFRKMKQHIKKQTARRARRDGKTRLEDAAPRRFRGWSD